MNIITSAINYYYNKWFKNHIENKNAKWFREYEFAKIESDE